MSADSDHEQPGPIGRLLLTLIERPAWAMVLAVLMVVAAGAGLTRLVFNDDYRVYFSPDDPERRAFEELENTYTPNYDAQVIIAPRDGDVFTRKTLGAIAAITDAAWRLPFAVRVDSVTNYQRIESETDSIRVQDLVPDARRLTRADLAATRDFALAESVLVNRLVSAKGHVTAIQVSLATHNRKPEDNATIMKALRMLIADSAARYPDIEFREGGLAAYDAAFAEATVRDSVTLVPLAYGVVLIVLWIVLRSLAMTGAVLVLILAASAAAMGMGGWLGMPLTSASAVAPLIVLTVCVADAMHLLAGYRDTLWRARDRRAAMRAALVGCYPAVALTNLTTVIGFLTMNFSDSPPLRDLGNIVAIGVAFTLLLSLTVLPAVVVRVPHKIPAHRPAAGRLAITIGELAIRWRRPFAIGGLVVAVLLGAAVGLNRLEDNFAEYFDESYAFRQSADFVQAELTGLDTIEFSVGSGAPDDIKDPAYLVRLDGFTRWLRAQKGVVHVASVLDVIKRINQAMHGDDRDWYTVPASRDLVGQYLLVYELALPRGLDLNNQLNLDRSAARVTVTVRGLTTTEVLAIEEAARAWLARHVPPAMQARGASPTLMFAHIARRNIDGMLEGSVYEIVAITLVLSLALRSLRLGALSLVPNVVPALMAFGIWGLLVGRIGLAASVVVSMVLGIIVDDTVHLLSKYQGGRRRGLDGEGAIRYAFEETGAAMLLTTLILVLGFGVLALSGFAVNRDLGALTALTIAIALVCDFTFVPAILLALDRRRLVATAAQPQETPMVDLDDTGPHRRQHARRRSDWLLVTGFVAVMVLGVLVIGFALGLRGKSESSATPTPAPAQQAMAAPAASVDTRAAERERIRELERQLQSVRRETTALRSRIEHAPAGASTGQSAVTPPVTAPIADPDADRRAAEALLETIPDRPRVTAKKKPPPAPVAKTKEGFSANPCQGAAAQFTSTCKR